MLLSYTAARQKVIEIAQAQRHQPARETVDLPRACGRVLADSVVADRDYPPFDRSTRDGFAVLAADLAAPNVTLPDRRSQGWRQFRASREFRRMRADHDGRAGAG